MTDVSLDARAAAEPPDLVELVREGLDPIRGFVVAVGSRFLLLHALSDRLDLDGYSAVRIADVRQVRREFPKKSFCLKALELKGIRPTVPAGIDLSSARDLLESTQSKYPLLVIDQEYLEPEECVIGRVKLASESTYALRLITPTATWMQDDRTYRFSDVTKVSFDGEYERTLALVESHAG